MYSSVIAGVMNLNVWLRTFTSPMVWAIFGTTVFALVGRPGWAAACGALWLVVTVDMTVILKHMREGPHYQPGRDIPPYRPPESRPR